MRMLFAIDYLRESDIEFSAITLILYDDFIICRPRDISILYD